MPPTSRLDHRDEQPLLVVKVGVHGLAGDPGARCNLVEAGAAEALLDEDITAARKMAWRLAGDGPRPSVGWPLVRSPESF